MNEQAGESTSLNQLMINSLMQLAMRCRDDAAVRARVESGDYSDSELDVPEGMELRIMQQTSDTFYFSMPPAPNPPLSDEALEAVAGGWSTSAGGPAMIGACAIQLPPGATPENLGWV